MAACIAASLATRDPKADWTRPCARPFVCEKAKGFSSARASSAALEKRVKCEESASPREHSTRAKQPSCGALE
jgi:hypothetical protein